MHTDRRFVVGSVWALEVSETLICLASGHRSASIQAIHVEPNLGLDSQSIKRNKEG